MADSGNLASRIDELFSAATKKQDEQRATSLEVHRQRQSRYEGVGALFDELRKVWQPRLETLVAKFGDNVKVTPTLTKSSREGTFDFQSPLARVRLKLSARVDADVRNVILCYNLEIIPVLMQFSSHVEQSFAIEGLDMKAVASWFDDRIIDFVRTYVEMGENEFYLRDFMVEDPIAHVRFPRFAAGASLDWSGKTHYFIDEETRREFAAQNKISVKD